MGCRVSDSPVPPQVKKKQDKKQGEDKKQDKEQGEDKNRTCDPEERDKINERFLRHTHTHTHTHTHMYI